MARHGGNKQHVPRGTAYAWAVCVLHTGAQGRGQAEARIQPGFYSPSHVPTAESTQGASFGNLHKCPLNMALAEPGTCEVSVNIN